MSMVSRNALSEDGIAGCSAMPADAAIRAHTAAPRGHRFDITGAAGHSINEVVKLVSRAAVLDALVADLQSCIDGYPDVLPTPKLMRAAITALRIQQEGEDDPSEAAMDALVSRLVAGADPDRQAAALLITTLRMTVRRLDADWDAAIDRAERAEARQIGGLL